MFLVSAPTPLMTPLSVSVLPLLSIRPLFAVIENVLLTFSPSMPA